MTDDLSAVKWGQLGSAGAAAGPAADGTGQGRDLSTCDDAPVGAPGMLHSKMDRRALAGALSAALREIPEQFKQN